MSKEKPTLDKTKAAQALKVEKQKTDEEQKVAVKLTSSLSLSSDYVPIFDRLFFAMEKRLDAYIEKRMFYKQIKKALKDAKAKLEEEKMTADEFAALQMPNDWVLP